jgi:hypothetical protein
LEVIVEIVVSCRQDSKNCPTTTVRVLDAGTWQISKEATALPMNNPADGLKPQD